ncbi:sodium-dependent transporter [Proteiniclasticum ruminis]|uniref:Transporter n=1 Tax=Proteiniclasticum ruminis TaxID=398199 RepID=A0A1G8NKT0_9CLOT|nr:sodium-dependent transporter [Proteiniclasticum ruminis]SDI80120.1 neurotransmitter:Na+ symporter, NSS family [Proteiniclasticum ruminis]
MENNRGSWSSRFGFLMAAVGSAVGLGNLWKFPYLAGENGGGAFVLVYIGLVVLLGFTLMLAEMTIGRHANSDAYGSYNKIKKGWGFVGGIGILSGFLILSYYSVVGGWVMKYIVASFTGTGTDKAAFFGNFISSPVEPLVYHLIFMGLTAIIVIRGISGGIEKASKFLMPALFALLLVTVIRSVTLDGAMEGIKYFVTPNFSEITLKVVIAALGQVFFSLSLGMGIMVTYGSYLRKDEDMEKDAFIIPSLDSLVAILAGFAILPAVFALGFKPGEGPGLMFITLPAVFENMPLGSIFGALFFVLVFFAALSSSISLMEVTVAFGIDKLKWSRKTSVIIFTTLMFIIGIGASLSMGEWSDFLIPWIDGKSYGIFDFLDVLTSYYLLPLGGLLGALFIGFVWGVPNAVKEIKIGSKFVTEKLWSILIKFVVPILVFLILLSTTGLLDKLLGL